MMSLDPRTPVIVGVGQQLQRIDNPLEALTPVAFIANAIREASKDAGLSAVPNVDSLRVISFLSWRYRDPARFIAAELGITTAETVASSMGGNSTQSMVNATALDIQSGACDIVILCGGETSRTRKRARAADIELPWPIVDEDVKPDRIMGEELVMNHEYELSRRIVAPIQIYPIFESAIRAQSAQPTPRKVVVKLQQGCRTKPVCMDSQISHSPRSADHWSTQPYDRRALHQSDELK